MRAFLILALAGLLALGCSAEPAPQAPFPWDEDGTVLNQLVQAGSDLTQPHVLQLMLYFPTEAQATSAADAVAKLSADIVPEIHPASDGDDWICLGIVPMIPDYAAIAKLRDKLTRLAEEHGGKYDGWQTSLVK